MSVFNVPQGQGLIPLLARQLLSETEDDPLTLGDIEIFLPNRRAVRSLQAAFLRESQGRALILPQLRSLGDAEDPAQDGLGELGEPADINEGALASPQPTDPTTRAFALSQLINAAGEKLAARPGFGGQGDLHREPLILSPDQAFRMAMSLGMLLDQAETEGVSLSDLSKLEVAAELAEHWDVSLSFLRILFEIWPGIEQDLGGISRARQLRSALEATALAWRTAPPTRRIIAAGSTGSIPCDTRPACHHRGIAEWTAGSARL